jgi:2-methylcitrate dehydratase PrpD
VNGIVVETFNEATKLHIRHPATSEEAQYSLPWAVSSALLRGSVGASDVDTHALDSPLTRDIANLVEMTSLPEFDDQFPEKTLARVSVTLRDGTVFTSEVAQAKGDPHQSPLSQEVLRSKFRDLSAPLIGDLASGELLTLLEDLDNLTDLLPIWECLSSTAVL